METLLIKIKNLKLKSAVYPISIILFFIVVVTLFIMMIHFVSNVINSVFMVKEGEILARTKGFDMESFEKVKAILGIIDTSAPPSPLVASPISSSQLTPVLEKSTLLIEVLNGSTRKGEAARLQSKLTALGFLVPTTGNADVSTYATTVVKTKESKKDIAALVFPELGAYTIGSRVTLEESDQYDMIIIIGAK